MNAQKLLEFLLELEQDGIDLSRVGVNYRHNDDSDVEVIGFVSEDLFHENDNSLLTSIILQTESESLIQSDEVDKLRLMYGFVTKFGKQLRDDYKSIPKKGRLITYEQFIVAQFSNLIEDECI